MRRTAAVAAALVLVVVGIATAAGFREVLSTEARTIIQRSHNLFLLDVRTPEEYRQAHLVKAVLIPIGEIEKRVAEVPKNRPVLVYCAVGTRSQLVARFLAERGYRDVYNMADGIVGWYRNGFPIQR